MTPQQTIVPRELLEHITDAFGSTVEALRQTHILLEMLDERIRLLEQAYEETRTIQ